MGSYPAESPLETRDYSVPTIFNLAKEKPNKTVDIGFHGTAISSDPFGGILQLSAYDPKHGIIVAAPYEQFDGSRYYEPSYVRQYRARMLQMLKDGQPGFGLRIPGRRIKTERVQVELRAMNVAVMRFQLDNGADVEYTLTIQSNGEVSQHASISNLTAHPVDVTYQLDLGLSVHRASYGQLTEGGPLPLPSCENRLKVHREDDFFSISNPFLDAHIEGSIDLDGKPVPLDGIRDSVQAGVLRDSMTRAVVIAPTARIDLRARFLLLPGLMTARRLSRGLSMNKGSDEPTSAWVDSQRCETYIIRRNVDYVLSCCSIPVSDTELCLITDHVALPLGWNRDNYWQWRLLLVTRRNIDRLVKREAQNDYIQSIDRTLKGHLNWVYRRAERPHKFWHRSYLTTGKPKDGTVFQLDQQCYPLLELCDYFQDRPDEAFVQDLLAEEVVPDILLLLSSKQDPTTKLFPTDETPGDDAVDHPFHFSSHVLLWHTLTRMACLFRAVGAPSGLSADEVQSLADEVRIAALRHFLATDKVTGQPMLAYLTDGQGQHTFYHDANDVPTVFAARWGFLSSPAELEAWRNTMDFATRTENREGFSRGGPFAGLGSVHSRGPWPLGYFQELMYAHVTENEGAKRDVSRRILGAMQWDGTFGEAVDVQTGATSSKAWFSWPGSMLGALLVEDKIRLQD